MGALSALLWAQGPLGPYVPVMLTMALGVTLTIAVPSAPAMTKVPTELLH